ncbi:uncharacterized protein N7515_001615 [Penicillium bovifimosum]|uniref:Uncharacterized protein n=1 Tax=Penicillium bovifimosum TaxID=126998 RepID=A0A9W9HA99_9EURO|nr:uncharacterized protein N7515_001615 [Penicillium bovifimosum]KAJ5142828.1 hypothetical protein N7515_001615 [Penicillium bovifimosum]
MTAYSCVLGKEFFWPLNDNPEPPFWPHLTSIYLYPIPVTPCGKWMFERDDDAEELDSDPRHFDGLPYYRRNSYYEITDQNTNWDLVPPEDRKRRLFRTKFVHELFNQYHLSAAKAALQMPRLSGMSLTLSHHQHTPPQHEFWFEPGSQEWKVATAAWGNGNGSDAYEPSEEVYEMWNEVALKRTDRCIMIDYADTYGN